MVRFWIIAIVVAAAFILFALVDAAMSDPKRARGVSKPIWIILIVLLPLAGALLWFTVGKARGRDGVTLAPDDDPAFSGAGAAPAAPVSDMDARLRDLEDQLKALDDETYPGEIRDGEPDDTSGQKRDDDLR